METTNLFEELFTTIPVEGIDGNRSKVVRYINSQYLTLRLAKNIDVLKFHNYQELTALYMLYVDTLLLMYEPGRGKTAAMINIINKCMNGSKDFNLKNEYINRESSIYKAYYLGNNETLVSNFSSEYMKFGSSISKLRYIDLTTHQKFALSMYEYSDDKLINKFEGSILCVDELHTVIHENINTFDELLLKPLPNLLFRLSRLKYEGKIKNMKIVYATATPTVNKTYEVAYIFSLLRGFEIKFQQILDNPKLYLYGYISFVRSTDTSIKVNIIGDYVHTYTEDKSSISITLNPVMMSNIQTFTHLSIKAYYQEEENVSNFKTRGYQADLFSPLYIDSEVDLSYTDIANKFGYIGIDQLPKDSFNQLFKQSNKTQVRSLSKLKLYSITYWSIITDIFRRMKENSIRANRYKIFGNQAIDFVSNYGDGRYLVYLPYTKGVGVNAFLNPLRYNDEFQFVPYSADNPKYTLSYFVISGEQSTNSIHDVLERLQTHENVLGEIKIIIITDAAKGISIPSVHSMYMGSAKWNPANKLQIIYRGLRENSYNDLMRYNPDTQFSLDITFFISYPNILQYGKSTSDYSREELIQSSFDIKKWNTTLRKSIEINKIMKLLVKYAFDKDINYHLNNKIMNDLSLLYNSYIPKINSKVKKRLEPILNNEEVLHIESSKLSSYYHLGLMNDIRSNNFIPRFEGSSIGNVINNTSREVYRNVNVPLLITDTMNPIDIHTESIDINNILSMKFDEFLDYIDIVDESVRVKIVEDILKIRVLDIIKFTPYEDIFKRSVNVDNDNPVYYLFNELHKYKVLYCKKLDKEGNKNESYMLFRYIHWWYMYYYGDAMSTSCGSDRKYTYGLIDWDNIEISSIPFISGRKGSKTTVTIYHILDWLILKRSQTTSHHEGAIRINGLSTNIKRYSGKEKEFIDLNTQYSCGFRLIYQLSFAAIRRNITMVDGQMIPVHLYQYYDVNDNNGSRKELKELTYKWTYGYTRKTDVGEVGYKHIRKVNVNKGVRPKQKDQTVPALILLDIQPSDYDIRRPNFNGTSTMKKKQQRSERYFKLLDKRNYKELMNEISVSNGFYKSLTKLLEIYDLSINNILTDEQENELHDILERTLLWYYGVKGAKESDVGNSELRNYLQSIYFDKYKDTLKYIYMDVYFRLEDYNIAMK